MNSSFKRKREDNIEIDLIPHILDDNDRLGTLPNSKKQYVNVSTKTMIKVNKNQGECQKDLTSILKVRS